MSATTRVLLALVLGLSGGLVVLAYPAPPLVAAVRVIEPVGTLWVNAIRMTVVPLVVSLLVTGVATSAGTHVVRDVGVRALLTFLGLLLLSAVVGLLVVPQLFAWLTVDHAATAALERSAAQGDAAGQAPSLAQWIVNLIPANPVKAAADGTMLPLVVFTLAFAVAILRVGPERRDALVTFFRGVAAAMLTIVRVVIALAPIGVFALMLPLASRVGAAAAGALGYYVVAMAVACLLMIALLYVVAVVVARLPVARFARGVFPAQAVAASSTSSLASLPALVDGAERGLGLPPATTGVVLPLAVSTFKIASPVVWMVAVVFLARFYDVALAPTQLLAVSATALLMSFSVPGVPHGWLLVITPLLVSMGIPAEGVGLLIAVDLIPDIFATTLNVTADMVAAAIVSRRGSTRVPEPAG
jgi:Na+/H+-dicarboxylate symporter